MKKFALSLLAVILVLTMVCAQALAVSGDLTTRDARAFADPEMTQYIGTIPKFTSVLVAAYGTYADVYVNGVRCFVEPSALTQGERDFDYIGYGTLRAGSNVYQRPTVISKNVVNTNPMPVLIYAIKGSCALIRSANGVFGFVNTECLENIKP